MNYSGSSAFSLHISKIKNLILVPKYYDPAIDKRIAELASSHDLLTIGELEENGIIQIKSGLEIGKMAYGTGTISFVRTSDIVNWELKTDPKQGISEAIYNSIKRGRDVQANDILFVRDGTYLVGTICIISDSDTKIVYQSHISKIRVLKPDLLDPLLLLVALGSKIVARQVYSKRLTADIIDTIGERIREIVLPIPKNTFRRQAIASRAKIIVEDRNLLKKKIVEIPHKIQRIPVNSSEFESERLKTYPLSSKKISSNILIPKYYNPEIEASLNNLRETHQLVTIGELVKRGVLQLATGDEIGKMAYGTGDIPFVRTSDIGNWELKADPKQGISEAIFQRYKHKQDVQSYDIFLVRDGTYLVGTSCLLMPDQTNLLYCGGIYKIRIKKEEKLNPFLLLGILNTPAVKQQIRAKQFTRDVIDTLGKRILEIVIPIPKSQEETHAFTEDIKGIMEGRRKLLQEQIQLSEEIEK